jgi:hypothetical protein
MLTTRTTLPWLCLAILAAALLCAWQSDAALQIGIRGALLLGGVLLVLLLDRD